MSLALIAFGCTHRPSNSQAEEPKPKVTPVTANQALSDYTVEFDTTKGPIRVTVHRDWAPIGAERFHELVTTGYFTNIAFFRVISGFMAQAGIHGNPQQAALWREKQISDDPVKSSNTRGRISFATAGPNTRTTQFFINFVDNSRLDSMGFAAFAEVQDMSVVDKLHSGYGEGAPNGRGPSQGLMQQRGNEYLKVSFPELDYIKSAKIVD